MIEEVRADPEYADAYIATAQEEINESGGLGGFFVALRQIIEARGGITEAARKSGLLRQSFARKWKPDNYNARTTCRRCRVAVNSEPPIKIRFWNSM